MPTMPLTATPLPDKNTPLEKVLERAFMAESNTVQFHCTHHPALSMPYGMANGLPVGLMLVGPHYGESVIYQAAAAFEKEVDWKNICYP